MGSILATDNFDRANENPLGNGVWSTGSGATAMRIVTNVATPTDISTTDDVSYYSGISWPADQFSRAKLTVSSTLGGNRGPTLVVRQASAANTHYRLTADHAASNNVVLAKVVAGTFTALTGFPVTQAWTDGDTWELQVQGSRLQAFLNGVQIGPTATDTAITSGSAGIGVSVDVTSASINDWEAGSLSSSFRPRGGPHIAPGRHPAGMKARVKQQGAWGTIVTTQTFQQPIDAVSTFTPALTKQTSYLRTLAVSTAWTVGLTKLVQYLKTLAVSSTFTPVLFKGWQKTLAVASTFTPALTRVAGFFRTLAVSNSWTASLSTKATYLRTLAVSSTFTVALTKFVTHPKTLAVASTFTVAMTKARALTLAVSSTFTAAMTQKASYLRTLAVTSTFSPVLVRVAKFLRTLAVSSTFTVALTRTRYATLAVTSTFTAAMTIRKTFARALAVASTFTTVIVRKKIFGVVLNYSASFASVMQLRKSLSVSLAAVSTFLGDIQRHTVFAVTTIAQIADVVKLAWDMAVQLVTGAVHAQVPFTDPQVRNRSTDTPIYVPNTDSPIQNVIPDIISRES